MSSIFGGIALVLVFVLLGFLVLTIAGLWKTFQKAGEPGWAAIIPYYNLYVLVKISRKPRYYFIILLVLSLSSNIFAGDSDLAIIGGLIGLANIAISAIILIAVAQQFDKSTGYGIGLLLLPFVFFPMLGFGDAEYAGEEGGMALED